MHEGRGQGTLLSDSEFPNSLASPRINTLFNNLLILESGGMLIVVNSEDLFSKVIVQRILKVHRMHKARSPRKTRCYRHKK